MASRVVLHIGQQKSGTTYLQDVLQHCVDELAEAGIRYPLPAVRRRSIENHDWTTQGLLGTEYPWVSSRRAERCRSTWERLERQVRRWPDTVLLSAEGLSVIRTPAIRRVVEALGAEDVHVVVTARSLGRSVPSLWQQHVRNGRHTAFGRYVEMLAEQRERPRDEVETDRDLHLWRAFAIGRLVRRWGAVVGDDRVRVVTSPGAPPRLLWARFARAVGAPRLADSLPDDLVNRRTHTGLTGPETEALLAVNAALTELGWPDRSANRLRNHIIAEGFAARAERGLTVAVPPRWRECVARWAEEDVRELRDTGVAIVGDVDELRYRPLDDEHVPPPSTDDVARAFTAAMRAVLQREGSASWERTTRERKEVTDQVLRERARRLPSVLADWGRRAASRP